MHYLSHDIRFSISKYVFVLLMLLSSFSVLGDTVQVRISAGNDDVEERVSDGDMYRNSSDLEMAHDDYQGGIQTIGLRFLGVNIPAGASINSAYVEFMADDNHRNGTKLLISAEKNANPAAFSNTDYDVSSRSKTVASVGWQPGNWDDNQLYPTEDLSSIIQEIVDMNDWVEGNDIVIIIDPGDNGCNTSNCRRRAESYNGDAANAPLLVIDYDTSPSDNFFANVNVDNTFEFYLSTDDSVQGTLIGSGDSWPTTYELSSYLESGQEYFLHVYATDQGVAAGFLGDFEITSGEHVFANGQTIMVTDPNYWSVSTVGWNIDNQAATSFGINGDAPWNDIDGVDDTAQWLWSAGGINDSEVYFSSRIVPGAQTPVASLEFRMDEQSWSGNNDDVVDSSANMTNGTSRNGVNTTPDGHLCYAGRFDGIDDYIESDEVYDLLKGTASMSVWIKTTQTGDNTGWRAPGISGVEQSGGSDDIFWGWLDGSGRIGISVANDFSSKSTVPINDGTFHHVVLTRDAVAGRYQIYIDGVLDNSGSITTGIIGNSFSGIGVIEDTGGSPEYFEGTLDELKIYNSVISAAQVTELYNESRICPIYSCQDKEYIDRFDTQSYSNSNGTSSWASSWIEVNDNNSANNGRIRISGGVLEIRGGVGADREIYRSVDLTDMGTAELSFNLSVRDRTDSDDYLYLYVYDGSAWTLEDTFSGDTTAGTYTYSLTDAINGDARVRFVESADSTSDRFYIDDLTITGECEGDIDHLEVSVSTTSASTCAPIQITVRACEDAAIPCTTLMDDYEETVDFSISNGRGDWSKSDAQGTLANGTADDGAASYQFVDNDDGDAVFDLSYIYADQIKITVTDSVNNLSVTSELVTFSDNAFVMSWDDAIHPSANGSDPTIAVAGRPHALSASYVRRDPSTGDCGVVSSYDGDDRSVAVWFTPSAAYSGVQTSPTLRDEGDADTVSLPSSLPASGNLNLDFVSGVADLSLLTSDVGQFTLSMQDKSDFVLEEGGDPVDVVGSSSLATIRPFGFALDIGDDCSGTAGDRSGGTNASAVSSRDANGSAYIAAGVNFPLTVKAVRWEGADDSGNDGVPDDYSALHNNACLPSFGRELSTANVDLSIANYLPNSTNSTQGALSVTTITGFSGGMSSTPTNYSEVGIIDVDAGLTSYLGVSGANVSGQLYDLGRFFPYQFTVTDNSVDIADGHEAGWSCNFTYQDQNFRFDDDIELAITAQNFQGNTTQNYEGSYWKLGTPAADAPNVISKASVSHGIGLDETSVTVAFNFTPGAADANGQGRLTFSDDLRMSYLRQGGLPDSDDVPFQAIVDWVLASEHLDDTPDTPGAPQESCYRVGGSCSDYSINDITNGEGNTNIRYGRAVVGNNAGSELMNLELSLQTQQWLETAASSGQYSFVVNDEDTCSDDDLGGPAGGWADDDITLSGFQGNLSASDTSASFTSFDDGLGVLTLSAPGTGDEGSVNVTFAVDDWLKYDFFQRGDEDPTGTATFGIFFGRQPIFYIRESYR